ncbi:hypothetical protein M3Y99_01482200 [Aphelenchoides fujianensis]|nr:hypothetical protein M3Y99_01482200 [Aphelenchoides fujianensis]
MSGRVETFGDSKVLVFPDGLETLDIARLIAEERNKRNEDDPFAVLNLRSLVAKFREWKHKLPRIEPFYAVKCNNDPALLRVLADLGCGFDCASKAEIDMIVDHRLVDPKTRVIFANPCKVKSYIKHAARADVRMMTFDNEEELVKIQQLHESPEMVLRISASDPSAQCQLSVKFGCEPTVEAPRLLRRARELNIAVIGISFHVGSGCRNPAAFRAAIQHARRLFDAGTAAGHEMRLLDIGGGFPGVDTDEVSFSKIVNVITPCLDEFFPADGGVTIIAEPGRFFAAHPTAIVANVIAAVRVPAARITGEEDEPKKEQKSGFMYYMNDGVYGSFNCILFDHSQPKGRPLFDLAAGQQADEFPTTIWGPTCDGLDQVEKRTKMRQLGVGDWIYFKDMGAYTTVAASNFNGFDTTATIHVSDEATWTELQLLRNNN